MRVGCCFLPVRVSFSGNAELRSIRKPTAVEHLRPREPECAHDGQTRVPHRLAETPARAHRDRDLRQTHGREERAEEASRVPVTVFAEQRQPGGGLLLSFPRGVVAQQVREPHLFVADPGTQAHRVRNRFTHRAHCAGVRHRIHCQTFIIIIFISCGRTGNQQHDHEQTMNI